MDDNATYFNSFGVEHIPQVINKFISDKIITTNIYRMQEYDSIMCGYFCIGFVDFMFKGKNVTIIFNIFPKQLLK